MPSPEENFNKGLKYLNAGNYEKGISFFKATIKQKPCKEAYLNLGTCYKNTNKFKLAIQMTTIANDPNVPYHSGAFSPAYPMALNNLGLIDYTFERDEDCTAKYLEVLKIEPHNYNTLWNLAEVSLRKYCSGKYENLPVCWDLYEFRFKRNGGIRLKNRKEGLITWDGMEPVDHLVVLTEQGLGDMLMFGRYLSSLKERVNNITVQCAPVLQDIFIRAGYSVCSDPIETTATHAIPMCSLGKIFNTGIPAGDWLKDLYVPKLPNDKLDIGVAWSGSASHSNNHNRSTSSGRFLPLSRWGNLYTLNPTEHNTKGFSPLHGSTLAETASNLSKLDLVITVDTSLAHLCGSLGVECWVLMPLYTTDFRWGDSSMGEENVWYDSVKVIRNPASWEKVFEIVDQKLEERANEKR